MYSIKGHTPLGPSTKSFLVEHAEIRFTGSSAASKIKSRGLRCKPSRVRSTSLFHSIRRSYILTNSVAGVPPAHLCLAAPSPFPPPSTLLPFTLRDVRACPDCEMSEGRKRFQLRYVSCTRDRTRGPYFSAILCDHRNMRLARLFRAERIAASRNYIAANKQIRSCDREKKDENHQSRIYR
jgi:hypothetical protein